MEPNPQRVTILIEEDDGKVHKYVFPRSIGVDIDIDEILDEPYNPHDDRVPKVIEEVFTLELRALPDDDGELHVITMEG